jgi:hypothetical protein
MHKRQFKQIGGTNMTTKSSDNLKKALTLLQQTAVSAQSPAKRTARQAGPDIGELFLAELRIRRVHLRKWIDMLNQEADRVAAPRLQAATVRAASQTCRGRNRQAFAAREQV